MVIMHLVPSIVRGYMIAKSAVVRSACHSNRYYDTITGTIPSAYSSVPSLLRLIPSCTTTNCSDNVVVHRYSALGHRSTVRLYSNSNDISVTESSAEEIQQNDDVPELQLSSTTTTTPPPLTTSTTTTTVPVWNHPAVRAKVTKKKENNKLRFRQHVNPLSRLYQQPTILPEHWPSSVYAQVRHRPLHLDIGCGKGGFLIDLCQSTDTSNNMEEVEYNYLGLEIRPGVATYAKDRIATHQLQGRLDFLGCNANVDLDRVLNLYQSHFTSTTTTTEGELCLHRVTIQFPDPHFKTQHMKRRVVTKTLVDTIAKYMPMNGTIILQSDIQPVLDDMRQQFRTSSSSTSSDDSRRRPVYRE
jgi:tRNA (guanine-N7-)-methyltransferase